MANANLPRAYGGVCFLVSSISLNYLVSRDIEKHQRQYYFEEDNGRHKSNYEAQHRQVIGDNLAPNGLPDDGNGPFTIAKGYSVWYL